MVRALRLLYQATNGTAWVNSSNWLQGDPCVNGWYGVTCCPLTHPLLVEEGGHCARSGAVASRRRLDLLEITTSEARELAAELAAASWVTDDTTVLAVTTAAGAARANCTTGVITGTDLDYARCAVVALSLPFNNLQGTLLLGSSDSSPTPLTITGDARADELLVRDRGLRDLQYLNVAGNELSGPLPSWVAALGELHGANLEGNSFSYTVASFALLRLCATSPVLAACVSSDPAKCDLGCQGLPPQSCDAFQPPSDGGVYVTSNSAPSPTALIPTPILTLAVHLALTLTQVVSMWSRLPTNSNATRAPWSPPLRRRGWRRCSLVAVWV